MANIEVDEEKELVIVISTKKPNPLMGLDWMKQSRIKPETGKPDYKLE